jgi:uroporphyrinogen decarboxylase
MSTTTSLERVINAVTHQPVDRIPLDLGSSFTTGITRGAYLRLAKALGVETDAPALYDVVQQLAVLNDRLAQALDVDVRGVTPNMVRKNPTLETIDGVNRFTDEWGIEWEQPPGTLYFHASRGPLAGDISEKDIETFPWPDTTDPALFEGLVTQARQYHEQGYAVILECICAGMFEMCCRVRGAEQFYMDMAMNPSLACALMDKFVALKIAFYQAAAEELGPHVQFIREGDDVAGQESLLMSPQMYRGMIKPRHKTLFEAQKRAFDPPFFVWFHSDGAIYDILPDFIEIGVEVLNPLQLTARGMDVTRVKSEFGKDLAFWGAGVNTQQILPRGTADEVRQDVRNRIEILRPGSGFVFGTVHNIQDDVPVENILAMLETFEQMRHNVA